MKVLGIPSCVQGVLTAIRTPGGFWILSVSNVIYLRSRLDRFIVFGECGLGGSEGKGVVTYP